MAGIIRQLMDGSEWCEECQRSCDSRCKSCDIYKKRMFTKDDYTGKTYYHGFNTDNERRCNNG